MYDWLKLIHILSSVLMVGTGFGSAFYMFMANRSRNVQAQMIVSRLVVKADWWFTTPAIIIQPVSGIAMMYLAGWPMDATWLLWSYGLYVLAALCWLPVVWLQVRMRNLAGIAAHTSTELPLRTSLGIAGIPGICCNAGYLLVDGHQASVTKKTIRNNSMALRNCYWAITKAGSALISVDPE
jgi:uncharacterized membrane protein